MRSTSRVTGSETRSPRPWGRPPSQKGGTRRCYRIPQIPRISTMSVTRMEDGGWEFSWVAGTPPYEVWLDGVLLATITTTTYEFTLPGYETTPPDLEVVDASETAGNELYPPYLLLQWRGVQAALGYVAQEFVGGVWVDLGTVSETGRGYYSWKTPAQGDGTVPQFRVIAVSIDGSTGDAITFTWTVVRHPAAPAVTVAITAGDVVVS